MDHATCDVCFRHCRINEGSLGFCGARTCVDGKVICANYGRVTSLALDPIEKKPLARFFPGSLILSVGSYGCNLRCPFCQNNEISWSELAIDTARYFANHDLRAGAAENGAAQQEENGAAQQEENDILRTDFVTPEVLADTAEYYKRAGNIGVAFTYNEPLIGYEYVRDAAKLVHEKGMKNVIVTNGTAGLNVLDELAPYVDAMNIDLKGFSDRYYKDVLGGDRKMVMDFIEAAVKVCHVELTTLIIPGENDSDEEMAALSAWVAGLKPSPEYYTDAGCGISAEQNYQPLSGAGSAKQNCQPPSGAGSARQNCQPSSGAGSVGQNCQPSSGAGSARQKCQPSSGAESVGEDLPLTDQVEQVTNAGSTTGADITVTDQKNQVTGADIPLHVTRFFPCFHMTDRCPTAVDSVIHLADVARKNLKYVYTGNI